LPNPSYGEAYPRKPISSMSETTLQAPIAKTVSPADERDVAEVIRRAVGDATAVFPLGGGTAMHFGGAPQQQGLGLQTERLCRLIDHAADDMTITVGAGMTVADLGRLLASHGQRLPIDACRPGEATVGGLVATNFHGPRRYGHGTMRDYVLGLRAVDGHGEVFSAGGRVVKNAAGYNICRMMVGSLGTLGVITQVTLMVRPAAETSAIVACDLPKLAAAESRLASLVGSQTRPVSIDLHAGDPRPGNPVYGPRLEGAAARLFVGFEGNRAEVDWMLQRLGDEWSASEVHWPMTAAHADAASLWRWLTEFPAQVRIAVRPSVVVSTIESLLELDPNATIEAHAGDGIIRARFTDRDPSDWSALIASRVRPLLKRHGGSMAVVSQPEGADLGADAAWGSERSHDAVSRAIKNEFDPHGILNPGCMGFAD